MKLWRALGLLLVASCSAAEPTPIHRHGLENAYWLTDKVLSGAQPEGDAAFGELAELGVKTIISVDGARPDGTGAQYVGLWASAREARKAEASELHRLQVDFRQTAPVPPLAEAMVGVDVVFDRLQRCAASGWKRPQADPDLDPPHEALRMREIFSELLRTDEVQARPAEFRALMDVSRSASERVEVLLRSGAAAGPAFLALKKSCADCHQAWRNTRAR